MSDQEISSFAKNAKKLMEQGRFKVAGDVVPIKRPLEPAPKPQSPATSEGMQSIDKMMDALRGPIKRP
jgi:hypothetical protein